MKKFAIVAAVALSLAAAASAEVLSGWTFETSIPTTAGPHNSESGVFVGQALGFHSNPGTVWSNPVGNGSAESFSSNFWTTGDYYQFRTSSIGYQDITIQWNQTRSSTGPGTFDLQYSTDGTNFFTLVDNYTVNEISWSSGSFNNGSVFGPNAGPAALNNQANVYFRLVSQVTPSNTLGTNRIDNVTISGVLIPEPASLSLLALGALTLIRRR